VHGAGSHPRGEAGGGGAGGRRGGAASVRAWAVGAVPARRRRSVPVGRRTGGTGAAAARVAGAGVPCTRGRAHARTHGQLEHIASPSAGGGARVERGVLAGGTVLVAHEAVSDTPAFLATRRLMRRFACVVPEAAALAELFLALEPGPGVVTHYEDEAARIGAALVMGDLVHLVAQLALAEEVPQNDALEHADALGDGVDLVDHAGGIAHATGQPAEEAAPSAVQWHALGTVHAERPTCPVCRAVSEADEDASGLPTCSRGGTRDTGAAGGKGGRAGGSGASWARSTRAGRSRSWRRSASGSTGWRSLTSRPAWRGRTTGWARRRLEAAVALGAPARGLVARIGAAPAA